MSTTIVRKAVVCSLYLPELTRKTNAEFEFSSVQSLYDYYPVNKHSHYIVDLMKRITTQPWEGTFSGIFSLSWIKLKFQERFKLVMKLHRTFVNVKLKKKEWKNYGSDWGETVNVSIRQKIRRKTFSKEPSCYLCFLFGCIWFLGRLRKFLIRLSTQQVLQISVLRSLKHLCVVWNYKDSAIWHQDVKFFLLLTGTFIFESEGELRPKPCLCLWNNSTKTTGTKDWHL